MLMEALVTFPNPHSRSVVRIPPNASTREAYRVRVSKRLKNNRRQTQYVSILLLLFKCPDVSKR